MGVVFEMESTSTVVSDELKSIAKHLRDLADECENSFALKAKLMKDL